jgi:hypothetical protein
VKIWEIIWWVVSLFKGRIESLLPKEEQVLTNTEEYIPWKTWVIQTLSNLARRWTENTWVSEKVLSTLRKYAMAAWAILWWTAWASAAYWQDFIVWGQTWSLERSVDESDSLRLSGNNTKDLTFKSLNSNSSNWSLIGNNWRKDKWLYSQNQDFLVPSTGYDVLSRDNRSKSWGWSFKLSDKTTVSWNTSGDSKTNSTSWAISYNDKDTYAELSTSFWSNIAPKLSWALAHVIKLNNWNKVWVVMKVSISAKSYMLMTWSAQVPIWYDWTLTIWVAQLKDMYKILNDKILMKTNSQIIDYEQVMAFSEFIHSMRVWVFHSKTWDKLNAQIQNLVEKNESIYRSYERITNLRWADSYTLYTWGSWDLWSQYTPVNLNVWIKWDRFNWTVSDKIGPSGSLDMAYIWWPNNEHKIYWELNADLLRIQTDGGYLYKQYWISTWPRISNIAENSRKPEQRFMIDFKVHPFDQWWHVTSNRVASDLDLASSIRWILNSLLMLKPISKDPASYLEFLLNQRDLISSADFLPITFINYSNAVDLARTTLNKSKNLSKDQINVIISQVEKSRSQLTFNSSDLRGTLSSFISSWTSLSWENFTKETWSKYRQALVEWERILSKWSRKEMTAYDVAHSQAQKMLDNTSHRVEREVVEKNIYVVDLKKLPEWSFMDGRDLKIPLWVNNVRSLEGVFPWDQSHFSIEWNYLRISDIGHLQGWAQYFMMFLLDSWNYWLPTLGTTHWSVEIWVKTAPEATFKKWPTEVPPDLVMAYVTWKITEAWINTVVSQINSSKAKLKLHSDNYEKIKDTSSSYVTESWIIYVQSIITAREILNKNWATKAEIDSAVAAVEKALEWLVKVDLEGTKVKELKWILTWLINQKWTWILLEGNYTPATWAIYMAAINEWQILVNDASATSAKLQQSIDKTNTAKSWLILIWTELKSTLTTLIKEFWTWLLVEKNYTPATWSIYNSAIIAWQRILSNSNSTSEITIAINNINTAKTWLVLILSEARWTLKWLIDEKWTWVLIEASYTPVSWAVYNTAIASWLIGFNDLNSTSEQIASFINAINSAKWSLVLIPTVLRWTLKWLIDEKWNLVEGNYTPATWAVYNTAIASWLTGFNNLNSTSGEITALINAINTAKAWLAAPSNPEPQPPTNQPGTIWAPTLESKTSTSINTAPWALTWMTNARVRIYSDSWLTALVWENTTWDFTWLTPSTTYHFVTVWTDKNEATGQDETKVSSALSITTDAPANVPWTIAAPTLSSKTDNSVNITPGAVTWMTNVRVRLYSNSWLTTLVAENTTWAFTWLTPWETYYSVTVWDDLKESNNQNEVKESTSLTITLPPTAPSWFTLSSSSITNSRSASYQVTWGSWADSWFAKTVSANSNCTVPLYNDSWWSSSQPWTSLLPDADWDYKICIFVKKWNTVQSTPAVSWTITLDRVPPTISWNSLNPVAPNVSISWTINFSKNVKITSVNWSNAFWTIQTTSTFSTSLVVNNPTWSTTTWAKTTTIDYETESWVTGNFQITINIVDPI